MERVGGFSAIGRSNSSIGAHQLNGAGLGGEFRHPQPSTCCLGSPALKRVFGAHPTPTRAPVPVPQPLQPGPGQARWSASGHRKWSLSQGDPNTQTVYRLQHEPCCWKPMPQCLFKNRQKKAAWGAQYEEAGVLLRAMMAGGEWQQGPRTNGPQSQPPVALVALLALRPSSRGTS